MLEHHTKNKNQQLEIRALEYMVVKAYAMYTGVPVLLVSRNSSLTT